MKNFLLTSALFLTLNHPLNQVMERTEHEILINDQNQYYSNLLLHHLDLDLTQEEENLWEEFYYTSIDDLIPNDILFFGYSQNKIEVIGLYLNKNQIIFLTLNEKRSDFHIKSFFDFESDYFGQFPYMKIRREIDTVGD